MIPYLQPNEPLTAAHWNQVFAEAETILATSLGGLSAVFATAPGGVAAECDRGFFFGFDPVSRPSTLHPVAEKFLSGWGTVSNYQSGMFWRQYDHSAITTLVAGLAQDSHTDKWQVVKLTAPTWATWAAAIYPSGFGSYNAPKHSVSGTDYPEVNTMDVSLAVLKQAVSGVDYFATFQDITTAEHPQPFKPIDAFTLGDLAWDSAWDKYSIVRVHNCGLAAATATFGSVSASIPAGSCQCFRKVSGAWIKCGAYFHTMQPDDPRFQFVRDGNGDTCSINSPAHVVDVVNAVLGAAKFNYSGQLQVEKFCDLSPIYNNPAYAPTSLELPTPTGGWFPALTSAALVGDLMVPRGQLLAASRPSPGTVHATMNKTVTMTVAVPAPSYIFKDDPNTVLSVSNVAVFNVTTGTDIPAQSDMSDITTTNWTTSTTAIAILPRGSVYDSGSGTFVPASPAPYAPFISQGDLLRITFDYLPPDNYAYLNFNGFATLAADLAAIGLSTRSIATTDPIARGTITNVEIYSATTQQLIDLGSALVTLITKGIPATNIGSTQSSTPPSVVLPLVTAAAAACTDAPTTTDYTYHNWHTDDDGNLALGDAVTVTVDNAGSTNELGQTSASAKTFLLTASIADVESWITTAGTAGGILTISDFELLFTPFGAVLVWTETWPLDAKFKTIPLDVPGLYTSLPSILTVVFVENVGFQVRRAVFLNSSRLWGSSGFFTGFDAEIFPPRFGSAGYYVDGNYQPSPPAAATFMAWHYPRTERTFLNPRWFYHDPADSPWMPASGTGWPLTSGWSRVAFPIGFPTYYVDSIQTSQQIDNLANFYEAVPLGVDTLADIAPIDKVKISRPGAFTTAPDVWSPFSYWLAGITGLTYSTGPSTHTINTGSGWYSANVSNIVGAGTITDPIPNRLVCQMEQYNALAGMLNAQPPVKYDVNWNGAVGSVTAFTLNFAAENIIIVNPGRSYQVGDSLGNNLAVAGVDGVGAITSVSQSGAVIVNSYDVYSTGVRPFAATGPSNPYLYPPTVGFAATYDTSSGDGSALNFIPRQTNTGGLADFSIPVGAYGYGAGEAGGVSASFWPRGAFFLWYGGSVSGAADPVGAYFVSKFGVGVETVLPDSFPYSGCSWLTITTARTVYQALGLPFMVNHMAYPCSWNGAIFVSDPAGKFLQSLGYQSASGVGATGWYLAVNGSPNTSPGSSRMAHMDGIIPPNTTYLAGPYGLAPVALLVARDGLCDLLVAAVPKNYAYADEAFAIANADIINDEFSSTLPPYLIRAGLGTGIVPIIADNTVESSLTESIVAKGDAAGGNGETVLTTGLQFARVITMPIDAYISAPATPPPPDGGI